jgi:hypothetical protein
MVENKFIGKAYLIVAFLMCVVSNPLLAQKTVVKGKIIDAETNAPMAFASVYFTGTTIGVTSDFSGNFEISTTEKVDSVTATFMGYESYTRAIVRGTTNTLKIELVSSAKTVKRTVINAKVNPAIRIIRKVQRNKDKYNKSNLNAYEYESFTKIQIAVNNISEKYKEKKFIKKIGTMFDTISYLSEDRDKAVLPVFISEVLSDFYFVNRPDRVKEVIKASNVKGVGVDDGSFVSQLLGSTFQQYNFHDNILPILSKNFVSPISMHSLSFYDYRIVNKDYTEDIPVFQIEVKPKNSLDLAFEGYIWVQDSTFALKRVSLSVPKAANLNFVEKLKITQEYVLTDAGIYIPNKSRILIDIAELSKQSAGMIALFTTSQKNIKVNQPKDAKFYDYPVETVEGFTEKSDTFWDNHRHEPLSVDEQRVVDRIDTLSNLPVIKTWVEIVNIAVDGYKKVGKFGVGPYVFLWGFNNLEGHRFRLGFLSNEDFSKKWILKGYGAYGLRDEKFKYMGKVEHILSRKRWTSIGIQRKSDVEQIGVNDQDYDVSNLFTALSISNANQLNRVDENKVWFHSEFKKGWSARVTLKTKDYQFEKVNDFNFKYYQNVSDTNSLTSNFATSEASVELRFAPREYFLSNENSRVRVAKKGDLVMSVRYTHGFKNVLDGDFNYDKIRGKLYYGLDFGYLGRTDMEFTVSKVFGNLPYPILNVHRGNESAIYGTRTYNLMNFFEFISDESVSLFAEHHFNGAIMNRMPLMKKLKWRLVLQGKGVYGSMTHANRRLTPSIDSDGNELSNFNLLNKKPYGEMGFGIENIFKIFRIDALHRLTYWDLPNSDKFAVKFSLNLSF